MSVAGCLILLQVAVIYKGLSYIPQAETRIIDANNADDIHTLSEMRMTRSASIENLDDKTSANAWWDNMIANNSVVREWKKVFRLSQPKPTLFLAAF